MIQSDEDFTAEEKKAIEELRNRTLDLLSPRLLNDQSLFYRFLRARDFNINNAEIMLKKHISDRKKFELEEISTKYNAPEHIFRFIPFSFVGYDKEGAVVLYGDLGKADFRGVNTLYDYKQIMRYISHQMEVGVDLSTEQSVKLGKSLTKMVIIANMEKLSLFQITYRKAVERLYAGFKFYQDNFPERSKTIVIINASTYFTMWFPIVKSFLAEILLQKIHIYGKNGWKDFLLEKIDADVLPAFLGGNRTDPDGNPLCTTFITHGEQVPEELYPKNNKTLLSEDNEAKKVLITRFSCYEMEFHIYEPNTQIEWEFETKSRDIAFGLYYRVNSKETSKIVPLIPKQRIDTLIASETGYYICKEAGTYILVFDNSYSWFHSKELYYKIRLIRPHEQKTEVI